MMIQHGYVSTKEYRIQNNESDTDPFYSYTNLFLQYTYMNIISERKYFHGDPVVDSVSIGVEQHGQQDPGGGGEQHRQAGHIGRPDWRPTHTHTHTHARAQDQ
jgi:hypothetical protein